MKSTSTPQYKAVIAKIIEKRKEVGMTQAGLAGKLGKHQSYVAKIETLERRIDIAELIEIGRVLGFDVDVRNV